MGRLGLGESCCWETDEEPDRRRPHRCSQAQVQGNAKTQVCATPETPALQPHVKFSFHLALACLGTHLIITLQVDSMFQISQLLQSLPLPHAVLLYILCLLAILVELGSHSCGTAAQTTTYDINTHTGVPVRFPAALLLCSSLIMYLTTM